MSNPSVVKQQHYVPQFHLKNWSDGKDPFTIGVYDKVRKKRFSSSTRNVGGQNWFYHASGESQPVEKLLMTLEGHAAKVYRKLMATEDAASLDEAERVALRMHIMALSVRTAEHRAGTRELYQKLADEITGQLGVTDWRLVIKDDVHRVAQLESVLQAIPRHELLNDHLLSVYVNKTNVDFITSDEPLTRYNALPPRPIPGGRLGLVSEGVQLHLPISPRHSILLHKALEGYGMPTKQIITDPQNALFFRSFQLQSSLQQVFGKPTEAFDPEQRFLESNPEIGSLERPRFTSD